MKALKLDHELAEAVRAGTKTSTWRVFDDKDLAVNDHVILIDKVDPHDRNSWTPFGEADIERIVEKRLADIGPEDYDGHEEYSSLQEILETYRHYYGNGVTLQTPVKILYFHFVPYDPERQRALASTGGSGEAGANGVQLYADGGSRGNPGPSASGFVLLDAHDKVLVDEGVFLGVTTNNQAEYTALKLGLEEARRRGARQVRVYMDSLLVINQMKGIFKVKNRDLWPIHDAIQQLVSQFEKVTFTHIPRELNKAADAAVNRALDARITDSPLHEVL